MTPADIRKKYRFPERVESRLEWRFYPKWETSPSHYLFLCFRPSAREFVIGRQGVYPASENRTTTAFKPLDVETCDALRSLLPAVAVAQCTAASLNPPDDPNRACIGLVLDNASTVGAVNVILPGVKP